MPAIPIFVDDPVQCETWPPRSAPAGEDIEVLEVEMRSRRPWWIAAFAAAILVAIGALWIGHLDSTDATPTTTPVTAAPRSVSVSPPETVASPPVVVEPAPPPPATTTEPPPRPRKSAADPLTI